MDNGEGRTGGQTRQLAGQWTGQARAAWMTSPSTRSINGEDGLDGKRYEKSCVPGSGVGLWIKESCNTWFVLCDNCID